MSGQKYVRMQAAFRSSQIALGTVLLSALAAQATAMCTADYRAAKKALEDMTSFDAEISAFEGEHMPEAEAGADGETAVGDKAATPAKTTADRAAERAAKKAAEKTAAETPPTGDGAPVGDGAASEVAPDVVANSDGAATNGQDDLLSAAQ